jgi:hypothetical protein
VPSLPEEMIAAPTRQETLGRASRAIACASAGLAAAIFLGISGWLATAYAWFAGDGGDDQVGYTSAADRGAQADSGYSSRYFGGAQAPGSGGGQPQARTGNS